MTHLEALTGEPAFETERLSCRRWLPVDVDALYRIYSDPIGARWVDNGQPITPGECEAWLSVTARNYEKRGYGMFALIDRASGATIGFCGLVHPGDQPEAEIKYAFERGRWGQGLASEVVPAMLSYAANVHGLTQVIATVAAPNLASRRVLTKSGFSFVKQYSEDDGQTLLYTWPRNRG